MLTQAALKEVLHYDPETGVFTWLKSKSKKAATFVGKPAGCISPAGYNMIGVHGRLYRAHRLAWLYIYGTWPRDIDHINGCRADNRLCNLREVTMSQNLANMKRRFDNSSGHKGVYKHSQCERWVAELKFQGVKHRLGIFKTMEEAIEARRSAEDRIHGEYARRG